jgi:flagellar FliJ protein
MGFVFKLQGLLNWKKNLEELAQMRLAEKLKQLQAEEEEIQRLTKQRSAYQKELQEKSVQGLSVAEYLTYQQYFETSLKDLLFRQEKRKITLREIEVEREKLIAFRKQKKILEKLKEKRLKTFMYDSEREDRTKNDERVISRYQSSPKVTLS